MIRENKYKKKRNKKYNRKRRERGEFKGLFIEKKQKQKIIENYKF